MSDKLTQLCFFLFVLAFSSIEAAPLSVNEVFKVEASVSDPNTINFKFDILANHYLYQKRLHFGMKDGAVGPIKYPKPIVFKDSSGRAYDVYQQTLSLNLPLLFDKAGTTDLSLNYQGCSASGFCYPPQTKHYQLTIDTHLGLESLKELPARGIKKHSMLTKTGELKTPSFTERSPALVLLGSYLLGLLLAFTPCVLPMIPIVSGIIVGQKKPVTKTKSFLLSACYVLSMSLTYALIGLLIALSGKNLQVLLQTPLVIVLFSALFVLLAFSLFGYFDLKLPESLTNRLSKVSQNQSKGAYFGAAIMGALATLILTPCVSAPLVGLLGFIAQSGNLVIGALGLFMLSLGMGTPLILVAVGAGAFLPNTGRWMNEVKNLFGVMMLGLAIYTLSKLISSTTTLYLSGLLLIGYGWQCRPLTRNSDSHTLYRTLGFASILYGALLIIGGAMGNSSFFTPLKSSCYEKSSPRSIQATKVQTLMALNEKLLASNRPSLVYFSANWCTSCHLFRKNVLETADIQTLLSHFNYLEVDLTKQTPGNQQIMAHYNVVAPPTTLFFVGLDEISKERLVGETNRQEFKQLLEKILLAVGK